MIRIYPSRLEGEPIETHHLDGSVNLSEWLSDMAGADIGDGSQPINIDINGVTASRFDVDVSPSDDIRIYPNLHAIGGVAFATWASWAAIAISVAFSIYTYLNMPKAGSTTSQTQGNDLDMATARANQARANQVIRESFGAQLIYPDYIQPPFKRFANLRQQFNFFCLSLGVGQYNEVPGQVFIGDTPVSVFGDDVAYVIYPPGADLSADPGAQFWHVVTEVGGTTTGAGLDLASTTAEDSDSGVQNVLINALTITTQDPADEWPDSWTAGLVVSAILPQPITVSTGTGGASRLSGDFTDLEPFVGMKISLRGEEYGDYTIGVYVPAALGIDAYIELEFDGGGAVAGIANGLRNIAIGYRNLQYQITAKTSTQITVSRLTDAGAVDAGWAGWVSRNLSDAFIGTDGVGSDDFNWIGPFMACPENEVTKNLEYDIFLPSGIGTINSKGSFKPITLTARLEWRDAALGGAWTAVDWSYSAKNPNQIGFTEAITLPYAMRPQVRMRRLTAVRSDTSSRDAINWYGLRSLLSAPTSYSDITVMTMVVRGGDRLSQQSENKVNIEAVRVLNGVESRSIKDAVYYVLEDLGVPTSAIDTDAINLAQFNYWGPRGEFYDHQHGTQQVARDVLQGMMAAGMAHLTIGNGKVSTKREGVQSMPVQVVSPLQMTSPLESKFSALSPDDYDGVDVEFMNELTWSIDTVKCRLDVANPVKIEKIQLDGVTDRDRAWRIGMRQLRKRRLQRWEYSAETEMDALNCEYLDRITLSDDAVGYSQSAMIISVDGEIVEVSEKINWEGVTDPRVRVRRHDGTATALYTPVRIDDYIMTIPGLDFVPDTSFEIEPATLQFGQAAKLEYPAMAIEISPNSDGVCRLSAVEYRDDIYADDDNYAP